MSPFLRTPASVLAVTLLLVALVGCEPINGPEALANSSELVQDPTATDNRGAASDTQFFLARIEPTEGNRTRGIVQVRIEDGYFRAKVRVTGATPGQPVPQHIHLNPSCDAAGGVLLAFDDQLRVPGEEGFEVVGENYPTANRGGVLQYEAERPLHEILDALGLDDLNLSERSFNLHQPFAPPVIGCGEFQQNR